MAALLLDSGGALLLDSGGKLLLDLQISLPKLKAPLTATGQRANSATGQAGTTAVTV